MSEVLVLYQISNEFSAAAAAGGKNPPSFNAFYMPRHGGVTLLTVKRSCRALQCLNPDGANGYHWRVRIDEKPNTSHSSAGSGVGGGGANVAYSWWDVQDENARLPVREATPKELNRMLQPPKKDKAAAEGGGDAVTQEVTKAAKGAMKYMGKAMNAVAGPGVVGDRGMDDDLHAPRTPVICFKLLDLGRARRDCGGGGGSRRGGGGMKKSNAAARPVRRAPPSPASQPQQQQQQRQPPRAQAPISTGAPRIPPHQVRQQQQQQRPPVARSTPPSAAAPPTADLMGFHAAPAPSPTPRSLHHANSMPARVASATTPTGAKPGESRAEKLKREYAEKHATSNRVWDDVDQRWVEGPVKNGETAAPPAGVSVGSNGEAVDGATAGVKGISLSLENAVGKSANVQAAVHARINEMEQSQQKAIGELRAREAEKARADAEEDIVRQRLEPRLRAWAEEHGKKKQLRALLANLHTILWEGSGWKQVSLADVLDDSKVKKVYHKASRVVHPDKTGHLDAEKRFVAKRVFDALTQAKVEFDEGKR